MSATLTSVGKEALRKTIRCLRETLIAELKEAAEREFRLGVPLDKARLREDKSEKRKRLEEWLDEQSRAEWPLAAGATSKASAGKGTQSKAKPSKGAKAKGANAGKLMSAEGADAEPATPARKKPNDKQLAVLRERYLLQAVKEAAHTLINRLVIVRILEHAGLSKPAVVTGGNQSAGYREFVQYAPVLSDDVADDSKGYAALLQLVFDELALELPGVFGHVGLTRLFPVPAPTLNQAIVALNDPELDSAWGDDTTLGWVYQFWNDPEREALDEKINGGGKIEPHEIAPKTQMFTERYMVEWLLQNSLGQTWLAMCAQHGWTPDFEQVRQGLDERRAEWRKQREAGAVAPDALMPLYSALEEQWKYWVPQPLPDDAPKTAPASLRELKLLDPACGSGHFLVIAFDQLAALYQEEARHRGQAWTNEQIARFIVEDNLHGIDIDPRAIQIAAAAVWLKAKLFAPAVRLGRMNLVAPTFKLGALSSDDPALVKLQHRLELDVGLPKSLTRQLVQALDGVDHLGSLLRVGEDVRAALQEYETENFGLSAPKAQQELFAQDKQEKKTRIKLSLDEAMNRVMAQLGRFLDAHEADSDLGLRLEGQQLAAGVRFLQIAREGAYDVVVGNPPYQGTSKMAEAEWFKKHYPRGKADLYACFLERGLELAKQGGVSALLTMRGWMFLSSYQALREGLLGESKFVAVGDIDRGGFEDIPDEVVAAAMTVFARLAPNTAVTVAVQPTALDDKSRDGLRTARKKSALLAQVGRYEFDVAKLAGIEGSPLVYWWDESFLDEYVKAPKLAAVAPARFGANTGNNARFVRYWFELRRSELWATDFRRDAEIPRSRPWVPFVGGAKGREWFEALREAIVWRDRALELRAFETTSIGCALRNPSFYFQFGIAFSMIGTACRSRAHRFRSVMGDMGSSVFPLEPQDACLVLCSMNSTSTNKVLSSLNPSVHFQVGDLRRVTVSQVDGASLVWFTLIGEFTRHESHREPSVEFKSPGPSPWRYVQDWAQRAVDRAKGEPLPPYEPEFDPPEPASFVSFAIGVALGRFGENGEGILDLSLPSEPALPTQAGRRTPAATRAGARIQGRSNERYESKHSSGSSGPSNHSGTKLPVAHSADDSAAPDGLPEVPNIEPSPLPKGQAILPDGILFVSSLPNASDSLSHKASERIHAAWAEHSTAILEGSQSTLEEWLRKDFFAYHKSLYENRPIYFPLSSENKNFVAWVSIHRWADNTLQALLANHLLPVQKQLQGEINDLNIARAGSDKKQRLNAEKQYAKSQKLVEELDAFIRDVTTCAEKGAPPTDPKCPEREVDAPFVMDLDDGVMINSAALWPLLAPQWKDPKKWWKELASADGRKDYDWAHLAARYWPLRVNDKCKHDPSLGVAHGCFWKYHPAKAYAWELRLQDEIGADFTIDEVGSDDARARFLAHNPDAAKEIAAKELQRRERKKRGQSDEADGALPETNQDEDAELESQSAEAG
jgi:hypothetical protein